MLYIGLIHRNLSISRRVAHVWHIVPEPSNQLHRLEVGMDVGFQLVSFLVLTSWPGDQSSDQRLLRLAQLELDSKDLVKDVCTIGSRCS